MSVGVIAFDGTLEEPLGALLVRADGVLYQEKRARTLGRQSPRAAELVGAEGP